MRLPARLRSSAPSRSLPVRERRRAKVKWNLPMGVSITDSARCDAGDGQREGDRSYDAQTNNEGATKPGSRGGRPAGFWICWLPATTALGGLAAKCVLRCAK